MCVAGGADRRRRPGHGRGDGVYRAGRPDERLDKCRYDRVARESLCAAGVSPDEIDVVQVYENFTGQVIMALEDFGFCKRGEGGPTSSRGRSTGRTGDADEHLRRQPCGGLYPRAVAGR